MARRARNFRRLRSAGSLAALLLLSTSASALADDQPRDIRFAPVRTTDRALHFRISSLDGEITAAKAVLQGRGGVSRVRPVALESVRGSLASGKTIRVRKPRGIRRGSLEVVVEAPAPAPAPEPSPAPQPAPVEPPPVEPPSVGPPAVEPPAVEPPAVEPPVQDPPQSGCGFGTFSASNLPGACWRPYSDDSPFNTPVAGAQAANGSQIVSRLMGFGSGPEKIAVGTADTANDWSHPIYYSQPSDPMFTVDCVEAWGTCEIEGMQVRIPDAARPAGGSDGHMAVIDQASGWEYDFWQVRSKPAGGGKITVSWGGRTRIDGDGLGSDATAAYFGLAAGMIRPAELEAGKIDHALFMVVKCTNGTSVAPAGAGTGRSCSEIGLSNANAPAMGQRFFLDMTPAEIDALPKPEWQKTILRALARYGAYVGDTGGGGWGVMFESGSSYTSFGQPDPWLELGRKLGAPSWYDASIDRTVRVFDMRSAANWGSELKVAAA